MSELREAAEKLRDAIVPVYVPGDGVLMIRGVKHLPRPSKLDAIAKFVLELTDPTPLSELTDEQWEELGFVRISGQFFNGLVSWSRGTPEVIWNSLNTTAVCTSRTTTLGQLRHLIAALGGDQ